MLRTVTAQILEEHLVSGVIEPGCDLSIRIDQTLAQDATGTLVMLTLEALRLEQPKTDLSVQYVDHNLLQEDNNNADDHLFLRSACRRFGISYSGPGNGVSHPLHMQRFGVPGRTLLGADSHTCAAGGLGMLAIGAGGLDVAMAIAGEPFSMRMPEIWGVRLQGMLPQWVSAKDVVLEMLRRHGVEGGAGRIIEYHGPGVATLSVMDRHVIASMGAELGAVTTVFPSDEETRRFLRAEGRGNAFRFLEPEDGAEYSAYETIDLSELEPLIALPSSPGKVVPVREVEGVPVQQAYVGSSANPGYRDFAIVAEMMRGRRVADGVSLDINPTTRPLLAELARSGHLEALVQAGARIHQAGCNGCIGMGQAPATGRNSVRTVPRNFPGRSGTKQDQVYLCSPETTAASAYQGRITDPRRLGLKYPELTQPPRALVSTEFIEHFSHESGSPDELDQRFPLEKGPNIGAMPALDELPDLLSVPTVLRVGSNVSTDEILPAGAKALPYRSNVEKIAEFTFRPIDDGYVARAKQVRTEGGHAIVAGRNYGQGSSREHAALAPRVLGLRLVIAQSFARIHFDNLINFGVVPLRFAKASDLRRIAPGCVLEVSGLHAALERDHDCLLEVTAGELSIPAWLIVTPRQRHILRAGGLFNWKRGVARPPGSRRRVEAWQEPSRWAS